MRVWYAHDALYRKDKGDQRTNGRLQRSNRHFGGHRALSYVVLCFVFFFASVKLAKLDEPAWTDHGGRRHPTAAMVPRSRRDRTRRLAIVFFDKTMSLK